MFSIGEFSKITGLSIKALRLYHEQEILVPRVIDEQSGYRYYDFDNVERARAILILRELMFPLEDIKRILSKSDADSDVIGILETHRVQIEAKIREMKSVTQSLSRVIEEEKNARQAAVSASYRVEEKRLEPIRIAGIRIKGRYAVVPQPSSLLHFITRRTSRASWLNTLAHSRSPGSIAMM